MKPEPLSLECQRRMDDFRRFSELVYLQRDELDAFKASDEAGSDHGESRLKLQIEVVQGRLRSKLAALGYASVKPEVGNSLNPGYIMAAMADEIMLQGEALANTWRDQWADHPLEAELFGTRMAGDRILTEAVRLASGPSGEKDVAIIILLSLLLGFRGRYASVPGEPAEVAKAAEAQLQQLRIRLYLSVYGTQWTPAHALVLPHTPPPLVGRSLRTLPVLRPWMIAIAVVLALYIPLSHAFWRWRVQSVAEAARSVPDAPRQATGVRTGSR